MYRIRVLALALAPAATLALAYPTSAAAHVANVEYRFPLPVWVFALAGAGAVLASVPAAAFGVRRRTDWTSRNLYPLLARAHLRSLGLALASLLLFAALLAGFANSELGFFNGAVTLFWIDLWVGLGIVSALVGNVWDFVSPLSALGRRVERLLGAHGVSARRYPEGLGAWPAVLFLLALSWAELVWDDGQTPVVVASFILGYLLLQLAGMALFGAEIWLARAELFTVLARTFSRLAPVELFVADSDQPCSAERCPERGERVGCPACFLDAPPSKRGVRLRAYGAGVRREPSLGTGGGAFVVALLATVVYDALRNTVAAGKVEGFFLDLIPAFEQADDALGTVTMATILAAFGLLFLVAMAAVARLEGTGVEEAIERYAPSLIPIAAVYFFAHYFLYLFTVGQYTPSAFLDPLGQGWIPEYRPWTGLPGGLVWALQAGSIVWGHVVAVIEAHRISLGFNERARVALVRQLPLAALMVTYTFTGLWVLGQALGVRGE